MKSYQIKVIVKKDLIELLKDKGLLLSLFLPPIIISILLPSLILVFGANGGVTTSIAGLSDFLEHFQILKYPSYVTSANLPYYAIFTYFFLPLFMLVPIMASSILAVSSLIGEKENKTMEGLLYTPLSPKNLILGKALACAIPAFLVTITSVIIYSTMVNILGWSNFGHIILPNLTWLLVVFVISPLLILLSILLIIGSSQYFKNSKSAQGIAMIIVFPILGMLISQSSGVLILGIFETIVFISILLFVVIVMFIVVVKRFNFEKFILNN